MDSLQGSKKQAELEKQVLKATLNPRSTSQEPECAPPNENYQSRIIKKLSSAAELVEEGTQSLRSSGLKMIADALRTLADRVNDLNQNLDLDAPIDEKARQSSKKRIGRAKKLKRIARYGSDSITRLNPANQAAAHPVAPESKQSPQGPVASSAV